MNTSPCRAFARVAGITLVAIAAYLCIVLAPVPHGSAPLAREASTASAEGGDA